MPHSPQRTRTIFLPRIAAGLVLFVMGCIQSAPLMIARAQSSLALTVTPPFIQLTINPGEFWASSIKVANTNDRDIEIYTTVMNFQAQGEEGHGRFTPIFGSPEDNTHTLAGWITVPERPILVSREKVGEVPFTIRVPKDASPGGHYAAVLIGTQPFEPPAKPGAQIQISSFISALFFVRIGGDVVERGSIRELSTDQTMYDVPEVEFNIRFENRGNVHIQPQGNVAIYNMWGKLRGTHDINKGTDFGNVLPSSTRKFSFIWRGERNFFDVGKYTAVATLAYGADARKNVSRVTSFWVVPLRETITVGGTFIVLFGIIVWGIRRYIQSALRSEMVRRGIEPTTIDTPPSTPPRSDAFVPAERAIRRYSIIFFVAVPIIVLVTIWLFVFFNQVLTTDRDFNIETLQEEVQ